MKTTRDVGFCCTRQCLKNFFLICSFSFCFHGFSAPLEEDQEQSLDKETASFFSSFFDVFNEAPLTEECGDGKKASLSSLEVQGLESVFSGWFSSKKDKIKALQRAAEIGPSAFKVVEMAIDELYDELYDEAYDRPYSNFLYGSKNASRNLLLKTILAAGSMGEAGVPLLLRAMTIFSSWFPGNEDRVFADKLASVLIGAAEKIGPAALPVLKTCLDSDYCAHSALSAAGRMEGPEAFDFLTKCAHLIDKRCGSIRMRDTSPNRRAYHAMEVIRKKEQTSSPPLPLQYIESLLSNSNDYRKKRLTHNNDTKSLSYYRVNQGVDFALRRGFYGAELLKAFYASDNIRDLNSTDKEKKILQHILDNIDQWDAAPAIQSAFDMGYVNQEIALGVISDEEPEIIRRLRVK